MKLYTEEQLHNTVIAISNYLDDIDLTRAQNRIEKHLKSLAPIELPSDEEIEHELALPNELMNEVTYMFIEGAKWMKEQIIKQANEK